MQRAGCRVRGGIGIAIGIIINPDINGGRGGAPRVGVTPGVAVAPGITIAPGVTTRPGVPAAPGIAVRPGVAVGIHQVIVPVLVPVDVSAVVLCTVQVVGDVQAAVSTLVGRAVDRIISVYHACTLLEDAVSKVTVLIHRRAGRVHQAAFDIVRRQVRVRLQHQRNDAARHCRGLRRTRHDEIVTAALEILMIICDLRVVVHHRQDVPTRGDHVGLDKALHRRAGRRERGQEIVRVVSGGVIVGHCADSDHVGHVARHPHRHRIRSAIAGCRHDHDPRPPGPHHRLVERVVPVIGLRRRAEREIQHTDVICISVGDDPIDAADDVQIGTRAIGIKGFDRHQVSVGGHAAETGFFTRCAFDLTAARHGVGDVRPVSAAVVACRVIEQLIRHRVIVGQNPFNV